MKVTRESYIAFAVQVHQRVTTDIEQIETELVSCQNIPCA